MPSPSANENRRIVLLHHTISPTNPDQAGRSDHFDLMVEPNDSSDLWTWACEQNPFESSNQNRQTSVQRLPDHRRVYLDYEGFVSKDQGHVRQVASGFYQGQLNSDALSLKVKLTPADNQSLISGSVELSRSEGTAWKIIFHSTTGQ